MDESGQLGTRGRSVTMRESMSLAPGARLGPYEVTSPLGAGGMGEVYRARDARLSRDVAIKILPAGFGSDPDRLMRFQREAQTLAALNHPHIAQIHGLEESTDESGAMRRALVMEFVDGEGLDARLARGPLPIDDAVAIARQIADALEAAHERGIVHRDLKPANVKLTTAGLAKVLDFGLAKALDPIDGRGPTPSAANSPTFTAPGNTQMGVILEAPRPTWRRNRPAARPSIDERISGHWAACSTRC